MPKGVKGFQKGHNQFNTGRTHFKKGYKLPEKVIKKRKESLKMTLKENGGVPKNFLLWQEKARKANIGKKQSEELKIKRGVYRKGAESSGWKGGKMKEYPERERIRKSIEYKLWRKAVFERDDFTCQKYGIKGSDLVAHHINNFAEYPELRFAIDNGITLSEKAHKEFHKKYGKRNNTKGQLKEFLINNNL